MQEIAHYWRIITAVLAERQHSIGHENCAACAESRPLAMGLTPEEFGLLIFQRATKAFLDERSRYVRPGTLGAYEDYCKRLLKFFSGMKVNAIQPYHIRSYQKQMSEKLEDRISNESINNDTTMMMQIQEMAGRRGICEEGFRNLPRRKWIPPKVLSPEQKQRFFRVAWSNPAWIVPLVACGLTANTSASGIELRTLRLQDIHLDDDQPWMQITQGKEDSRLRTIPLNAEAVQFVRILLDRAHRLGSVKGEHYVFPFRDRKRSDPTRPASPSWMNMSFRAVREAADMPEWLTPHVFRHQIITELLEMGTHEQTIISIAGHVDRQMLEHYSHIRMKPKAVALDALICTDSMKIIKKRA